MAENQSSSTIAKLLEKLSHYEIMNYLIPGSAFCFILKAMGYGILDYGFVANVMICYIAGLVNSRVSSVIFEDLLKKWNFVEWRDHDLYFKAKKMRPYIGTMSESANMYRAFVAVAFNALVAYGFKYLMQVWPFAKNNWLLFLLVALLVLFLFAYRKQTNKYVVGNIAEALREAENHSESGSEKGTK